MEAKVNEQTDDYWFQAQASQSTLKIAILTIENQTIKDKLCCEFDLEKQLKIASILENNSELIDLLSNHTNYLLDFETKTFTIVWTLKAGSYEKSFTQMASLKNCQIDHLERLTCENLLLRQKLQKFKNLGIHQDRQQLEEKQKSHSFHNDLMSKEKTINNSSPVPSISREEPEKEVVLSVKKTKPIHKKKVRIEEGSPEILGKKKAGSQKDPGSMTTLEGNKRKVELGDGDFYQGELKGGKFHGFGILQSKTFGRHEGSWKNGVAEGQGQHIDHLGNKYTGSYRQGKREGKGVENYVNGEKYEGMFEGDFKKGYGKYFYLNGDVYEGEWDNDVYHGKGKQVYANGSSYEGIFDHDEKDSWGLYIDADGARFSQLWEKGIMKREEQIIDY